MKIPPPPWWIIPTILIVSAVLAVRAHAAESMLPPGRLLFSALFAEALAPPTDEPSDHERGQQERDDHA